jgi:protein N-terminal glutamine amidohydrolase
MNTSEMREGTNDAFLPYAHCYCEENTYICVAKVREFSEVFDQSYSVFMSSYRCHPFREKSSEWKSAVPYRKFESADVAKDFVIWDYHVIAVVRFKQSGRWFVVDQDSALPRSKDADLGKWGDYCIDLEAYCYNTLFLDRCLAEPSRSQIESLMDAVKYRVIDGATFLCFFRSDRSHMVDSCGQYSQPPPAWPPIQDFPPWADSASRASVELSLAALGTRYSTNNIACLINMANTAVPGRIIDRHSFLSFFRDSD